MCHSGLYLWNVNNMKKWTPGNYEGSIFYDPRAELLARTRRAIKGNDTYVAIPVELAIACGELRECGARTILKGDEEGPFKTPIEIQCRRIQNHREEYHFNGAVTWK